MQAATGELNLTLVTVVAIGLLLALFTGFMWPSIKNKLNGSGPDTNVNVDMTSVMDYNRYQFVQHIESELF